MSQGADTKNDTMDSSDSSKGKKRKKEMTEEEPANSLSKRTTISLNLKHLEVGCFVRVAFLLKNVIWADGDALLFQCL